jgi:hypothetical protein
MLIYEAKRIGHSTDQRIHWIGHRGEGPSHAGQLRTVCILS